VDPKKPMAKAMQAIGGNVILVRGGRKVPQRKDEAKHPRTVIGLDRSGTKLILLVVDGRQPNLSTGMNYAQLSDEMIRLGAYTAVNLDGGGSTTLVMRDGRNRKLYVMNKPSDGKPRPVADVLGIRIEGGLPTTRPGN
jgi:exopolysaccharide biosynthesis protein